MIWVATGGGMASQAVEKNQMHIKTFYSFQPILLFKNRLVKLTLRYFLIPLIERQKSLIHPCLPVGRQGSD